MSRKHFRMHIEGENSGHTQQSAHRLAPDLGTTTAIFDIRFAAGITSLLHPTATHTSPTPKALR